jgi:radical SAM protein with 4Fe4S-binding SPASM domain
MGNDTFLLGTVESTYNELMDTKVCRAACTSSILEALPSCSDCVYQPYCGVCPAVNYALYGDLYEKTPGNYRCQIYRGMLDIIFEKLQEDDYSVRQIFRSWIS